MLNRSQILGCNDIKIDKIDVPEWGGEVGIKTLSLRDRDALDCAILNRRGEDYTGIKSLWASRVICDDTGTPLFSDCDLPALSDKSEAVISRIVEYSKRTSGVAPGDVADAEKN